MTACCASISCDEPGRTFFWTDARDAKKNVLSGFDAAEMFFGAVHAKLPQYRGWLAKLDEKQVRAGVED